MCNKEYDWFKLRQQIYCRDSANHLLQIISKTNMIEKFLLEVRWEVVTLSREKNDKVLDTLLFYFDTQLEDLESIANLCYRGLFSSSSAILRRVFLSLGKMLTLVEQPSLCEEIRQGKQQKDRDVVDVLENLGVSKDKYIYPSLCESTHLNFNWAWIVRYARALGPINEKNHLLTEGILLTALRFTIQSASLLILYLNQRDSEDFNSLVGQAYLRLDTFTGFLLSQE